MGLMPEQIADRLCMLRRKQESRMKSFFLCKVVQTLEMFENKTD
jgi:hypothetical protein